MRKNENDLVLFWGWLRGDKTYESLQKAAPIGWNIHVVSYEEILPIFDSTERNRKIIQLFDEKGLDNACVLGHSLGGAVAIDFTAKHPERVVNLYLADSEGVFEHQSPWSLVKNVLETSPGVTRKELDDARSLRKILKKPLLYAQLAMFAHFASLEKEAASMKVPTTILWGELDNLVPLSQGKRLNQLISGSKIIVLPNLGHDWILFRPELFWKNI